MGPIPSSIGRKTFSAFYDLAFDELEARGGGKIECSFADGSQQTIERIPMPDSNDPNDKPLRSEDLIEPRMSEVRPITKAMLLVNRARTQVFNFNEPRLNDVLDLLAEAEKILLDQDARTGKSEEALPST